MDERGRDWRTIVLAVGASGSALLALAAVPLLLAYTALASFRGELAGRVRSPLDVAVLAAALVVIGMVFLPAAYYSFQRLRGGDVPPAALKLLRVWQGILMVLLWLGAAVAAQLLLKQPILKWVTPAFYVIAIGLPVYFFARLATGGLRVGSRQRLWGVLAAGITLGTSLSIIAELLVALLGLVGVGIYVAAHPEQLAALKQIAAQLSNASGLDQVLNTAGPWLNNPVAILLALLFFSILSPIIEETAKSLATWTVFDHLTSSAQGFAVGAMSGAAFGLVESLLVSATPDSNWTTTLLVRGASTMMHIMAASLTGWGIATFRLTKRPARMIGMYALAMSLHGLWNACVVGITFGGLRTALNGNAPDAIGLVLMFAGGAVLLLLCLVIPLALGAINWRFRAASATANHGVTETPSELSSTTL
jgi:hypothetical protein